jgi:hypothetical protein
MRLVIAAAGMAAESAKEVIEMSIIVQRKLSASVPRGAGGLAWQLTPACAEMIWGARGQNPES